MFIANICTFWLMLKAHSFATSLVATEELLLAREFTVFLTPLKVAGWTPWYLWNYLLLNDYLLRTNRLTLGHHSWLSSHWLTDHTWLSWHLLNNHSWLAWHWLTHHTWLTIYRLLNHMWLLNHTWLHIEAWLNLHWLLNHDWLSLCRFYQLLLLIVYHYFEQLYQFL